MIILQHSQELAKTVKHGDFYLGIRWERIIQDEVAVERIGINVHLLPVSDIDDTGINEIIGFGRLRFTAILVGYDRIIVIGGCRCIVLSGGPGNGSV